MTHSISPKGSDMPEEKETEKCKILPEMRLKMQIM